ncbi:hypothetical protein [Bacillus bombysepticus]|uniref:hypothetical protein n=1 Tax=Bacillus bombysepticus TaxID=658666 RepID=UPI003018F505
MKAYSAANLLGKEVLYTKSKRSLLTWFDNWLDSRTSEVELSITIPHSIYLRTRLICDYIQSVYESPMNTAQFLNILYVDFIHRNMKRHNPKKIYEELTQYDIASDTLEIHDPRQQNVVTFKKKYQSCGVINYSISKKNIKRGEMFLAELHELIGKHYTVEVLLSTLWVNFIQSFSDGNNEKAVDKLLKLAAKNFN